MDELSVQLLAGVQVVRDGRLRQISSRRQRAVVAALGLHPGRAVAPEQLIDALWGDRPPDGARATLQTYVSRLRAILGEGVVVFGPAGYWLADGVSSDVQRARQLADEARACLGDAPEHAVEAAQRALVLWRGRPLGDLADDQWFAPAASGLAELHAHLVELSAEALVSTGRPQEAIELLEPAARADPLREPTHVRLIEALCAAGRHVDAVRVADRHRRQVRDETGLEPSAELAVAEQQALDGGRSGSRRRPAKLAAAPVTFATAVLPRANRLIGRDDAVSHLRSTLATRRLVTVCGPGGVGKTRLVAELVASPPSGTSMAVVELAPVDRGEVAAAVSAALRRAGDRATTGAIAEHLHGAEGLLVIDNAEHVIDEVRELARAVLGACPGMRILVTSRARLDLPEEQVLVLPTLGTSGERAPAVQLFLERLARAGRTTTADSRDEAVRRTCARLDGLPLALELAAGRAAVLGVDRLADRLDAALDLIATTDDRDRHASLRRVVEWSYDLLDRPARRLLATLAVFEGDFDLDAAEELGTAVLGQPVSLLLGRLVDVSLVATSATEGRYRVLEMIRQFGRDHLSGADAHSAHQAHTRWVGRQLQQLTDTIGAGERYNSREFARLRAELRGALRSAHTLDDSTAVTGLLMALAHQMLYRPDVELIDAGSAVARAAIQHSGGAAVPAAVAAAGARLAFLAGDLDHSAQLAELADTAAGDGASRHLAQHARGVGHLYRGRPRDAADAFAVVARDPAAGPADRLDALGGLGLALCYAGDEPAARGVVAEHRAIADAVDSDTYRAFADYMDGELALADGDVGAAARHLRDATERAWAVEATFIWGIAATVLAGVLVRHRSMPEARAHLRLLLERWRSTGTWTQAWTSLRLVAELLAQHGAAEVALLVLLAADLDGSAPRLTGDDMERDRALRTRLRVVLGGPVCEGIATGAAALPRAVVLTRALNALDRLA